MRTSYSPKSATTKSVSNKSTVTKKSSAPKGKSLGDIPVKLDKNDNISISEIENGFLVSQSGYTGKGKNQQWYNKQFYTPTNPIKFSGKK